MAKMSLHKSKHGCVTKQTEYDGLSKAIFWRKKLIISKMPILETRDLRLTLDFNQIKKKLWTGRLRRLRVQERGTVGGRDNVWKQGRPQEAPGHNWATHSKNHSCI